VSKIEAGVKPRFNPRTERQIQQQIPCGDDSQKDKCKGKGKKEKG
jgi:hypothetical protein